MEGADKAKQRTFGWVQDSGSAQSLKRVIQAMIPNTKVQELLLLSMIPKYVPERYGKNILVGALQSGQPIEYGLLKGKGNSCQLTIEENIDMFGYTLIEATKIVGAGGRGNAACTGIVQICLPAQKSLPNGDKKPYQGDWQADCFLRWAVSLGLLKYNSKTDTCEINEMGYKFANTANESDDEKSILGETYLSYPPVIRILNLLSNGEHLTKFELGNQLGFIGEAGFTSIPQNIFVSGYCDAPESKKIEIRQNVEGSADKYARMMAGWLCDIGWLKRIKKDVTVFYGGREYSTQIGQAYQITLEGLTSLKKIRGTSNNKRIPKNVFYEMLATKTADRDYVRNRRAHIIQFLSGNFRTIEAVIIYLSSKGVKEEYSCVLDDILGLERIGLDIKKEKNEYYLSDDIVNLKIPKTFVEKTDVSILKDAVRDNLKEVDHKYLSLIDLSFDSEANRDFEIQTMDLLTNELGFGGMRLGDTRKPDGIASYKECGLIIDNKSYSKGYTLPISQADEMVRYIEENKKRDKQINPNKWWENFDAEVKNYYFLFVSSVFTGGFEDRLCNISARTGLDGGAISSQSLLYLAENLKSGKMSYNECFTLIQNREIQIVMA